MLQPGDQIHHYIVEERVGGGGMAQVYRVRHTILGHPLALKVLDPLWVGEPRIRRRFLSEGRIQAMVRHPAIVMVTDAVVDASRGIAGLVMEYVEGPDLQQVITRMEGPAEAGFVRAVMLPVLEGMHHVHREGVVHRDLKPANVLLSRDAAGRWLPRVVDFGVAHVGDDKLLPTGTRITRADARLGTPAFMCPEQICGGRPDPRWDVFSLGVVLYELATGRHPFEVGDDDATMAAIAAGRFHPPRDVFPELDAAVEAAILGSLQPDPASRFPSCAAFAAALSGPSEAPSVPAPPPPTDDDEVQPTGHAVQDHATAALLLGAVPSSQERWVIEGGPTTVGASEAAEVTLPAGGGVEDVHCRILHRRGQWILEDRSLSGSRVNGARVRRIQLAHGDLIRLGHTVLRFEAGSAPLPVAGGDGPWIEVEEPRGEPRRVQVTTAGLVVGRDPGVEVPVSDPMVAARHCRIVVQGLDVVVEDLDSLHGTYVDDQRIRYRRLRGGEVLRVGATRISFERGR